MMYGNRNKGNHHFEPLDEYLVFDLETTGLSPQFDEIIEFSGFKIKNGEVVDHYETLIKPPFKIDPFIEQLTGITNQMLESQPSMGQVIDEIETFVSGSVLLGHNVHFDLNFLYDALLFFKNKELSNDFVDLMRISRKIHPEWKSHTLSLVADHLQTEIKPSHRASNDALATYLAYEKYKPILKNLHLTTESTSSRLKIRPESISSTVDESISSIFHGEEFVFTGKLDQMDRKTAWQMVVNSGGTISDTVTKNTNYLVLGNLDYSAQAKGGKSSKLKKAEELILGKQDLKIISESVFYDLIETEKR